jgi:mxaJ protein
MRDGMANRSASRVKFQGRTTHALLVALALATAVLTGSHGRTAAGVLRVCADPNNLPFSHRDENGFENRLARLLGKELGMRVETTWWAQRRGFFRSTLKAKTCDVVMGVPSGIEMAATTRPYYVASYAFVSRKERAFALRSFDDPRLRTLRIGVQLVGDDGANSPPIHALARRGIVTNVVGYSVLGDYSSDAPLRAPVAAVDSGEVDVAVVWGPVAGYFASSAAHPLDVVPVESASDAGIPLRFEIALAVRHADHDLRERLDRALVHRKREIRRLLSDYGVEP